MSGQIFNNSLSKLVLHNYKIVEEAISIFREEWLSFRKEIEKKEKIKHKGSWWESYNNTLEANKNILNIPIDKNTGIWVFIGAEVLRQNRIQIGTWKRTASRQIVEKIRKEIKIDNKSKEQILQEISKEITKLKKK